MSEQHEHLPMISERAGGDQAQSVAHTDNVVRADPPPAEPAPVEYDLRASSANGETRRALDNDDGTQDRAEWTVGDNAPAFNQLPHNSLADQEGRMADPEAFLLDVMRIGRFADRDEAAMWTRAVVYALWRNGGEQTRAVGGSIATNLGDDAIWGGDFVGRFRGLIGALNQPARAAFVSDVAEAAGCQDCDPWAEDAVYSFFAALKARIGAAAVGDLGELRPLWER